MAESHEQSEVKQNMKTLRECAEEVAKKMRSRVTCSLAPPGCTAPPDGSKLVHFIRHGEGFHNVAQREWRADPKWDGTSEPYTRHTDPDFKFIDAELNAKGEEQAKALQQQTANLQPQMLVVSPMRRATVTGLLAFAPHIERNELPVLANELCHERAGKHTCDKRLRRSELKKLYPNIDYKLVKDEDDPFWGYGLTREPWGDTAMRAGYFINWLMMRPEKHIAVAAHSAILLSIFNAARKRAARRRRLTAHLCTCAPCIEEESMRIPVCPCVRSRGRRAGDAAMVWYGRDAKCYPYE